MKKHIIKLLTIHFLVFLIFSSFFITTKADTQLPRTLQFFLDNQGSLSYKEDSIIINFHESAPEFISYLEINYSFELHYLYNTTYNMIFDNDFYLMEDLLIKLHDYPIVNFAEPNYILETLAHPTTEPLYHQQWAYTNNNYGINIVDIWDETYGNDDIVVAIIDTGIYRTHVDFVPFVDGRVWTNPGEIADNGIDDDGNGYIDDYYGWDFGDNNNDPTDESGHGTFVAGIVAGAVNDYGITGTAPGVKMMGLKVENSEGLIYVHNIVAAINYALSHDVKIFNISLITTSYSRELENIIEGANAIFICAAGNDGVNIDETPYYPASYNLDNIISVASIDANGQLSWTTSWSSNYGPNSVHIAAPGSNIISTIIPQGMFYHGWSSGTSLSTPYVSGVAALLLSKNPDLTPQEVRESILMSAKKIPSLENKVATEGILDAYAAYTYDFNPPTIILGDLNGDDVVTISDLIILRRHLAGIEELDEIYLLNADVNQDGSVTISDLIKLRRYLAGLEEL